MTARPEPSRARLFVALELPGDAQQTLAGWAREVLGGDESLRLVSADALHVTLAFLGWSSTDALDAIASAALGAVAGKPAPLLRPRALVGLPRRDPRVLAIDLHDDAGAAAAVQAAVSDALVALGAYAPERRSFRPHVTVARVRRGGRAPSGRLPDPPAAPVGARDVVLFRSDLRPSGARYTALARATLAEPRP